MASLYINEIVDRVRTYVWGEPLHQLQGWRYVLLRLLRTLHMVVREISSGGLPQRSASLVFTTILSLVPLLAVSFSVMKGFDVHYRLEAVLFNLMSPLGPQGQEFALRIVAFVDNVKVGVLGGVGLVILIFTVLSLLHKVEAALNHSWRVRQTRGFTARFSGYLSVLLVGPLLVITALGIIGTVMGTEFVQSLQTMEPVGIVVGWIPRLMPYLLIIAAFSVVYLLMPNTEVHLRSALVGGVVAGALWASAGWGFASFVVNSPESNYTAIYSSFAIVFFFMLWLYVAWAILLIGGTVAFYYQHPQYLGVMPGELSASNRLRERIALAVLIRVARAHVAGDSPPDETHLSTSLALPALLVEDVVDTLIDGGFVARVSAPFSGLVPARAVQSIALVDVLGVIRSAFEHAELTPGELWGEPAAEALMQELEHSASDVLADRTLADLLAPTANG